MDDWRLRMNIDINLVKILVWANKIVEWSSLRHSSQSSVNLRPPFWIFFTKTADLETRLHAFAPMIGHSGWGRIWLLFHRKFINCPLKHSEIWKQGQKKYLRIGRKLEKLTRMQKGDRNTRSCQKVVGQRASAWLLTISLKWRASLQAILNIPGTVAWPR